MNAGDESDNAPRSGAVAKAQYFDKSAIAQAVAFPVS
jgi:hypothetical protein